MSSSKEARKSLLWPQAPESEKTLLRGRKRDRERQRLPDSFGVPGPKCKSPGDVCWRDQGECYAC